MKNSEKFTYKELDDDTIIERKHYFSFSSGEFHLVPSHIIGIVSKTERDRVNKGKNSLKFYKKVLKKNRIG